MSKKSTKKDEDAGIKALAEALRAGGKLLSLSCPICAYPLIEIDGKKFCKICDNEVVVYKDESELSKEQLRALKQDTKVDSLMSKTINDKIESLRKKIEQSDNPDEIIKLSEAIEKLHNTLKSLEN
ncbi:MAG: hypothetical protein FK733_11845 [Asgard group archaeon]|nr:hypothetical protein [Asgard group archaeon]